MSWVTYLNFWVQIHLESAPAQFPPESDRFFKSPVKAQGLASAPISLLAYRVTIRFLRVERSPSPTPHYVPVDLCVRLQSFRETSSLHFHVKSAWISLMLGNVAVHFYPQHLTIPHYVGCWWAKRWTSLSTYARMIHNTCSNHLFLFHIYQHTNVVKIHLPLELPTSVTPQPNSFMIEDLLHIHDPFLILVHEGREFFSAEYFTNLNMLQ